MKHLSFASLFLVSLDLVAAHPTNPSRIVGIYARAAPPNCFPALGFTMPSKVPSSLTNWWCTYDTEYAFVGFSYEITACQSLGQLKTDFSNIRQKFGGRYVRLYGFCDKSGYYNDVVEAAWNAGIGVFALIWFGFDGTDAYIGRRDALFAILQSNPKAKFVTRALQFGSEPLFDWSLDPSRLVNEVQAAKKKLANLHVPVTVSDLAYSFRDLHASDGGPAVLASLDVIAAHILPFFSASASTADKAWPIVMGENLDYFIDNGSGRKIWFSQNGWPSVTSPSVQPNSPYAVADVQNEHDYYTLLDKHCADLKAVPGGGVGWFAHIYYDDMESGYGIYNSNGTLKFPFAPRTSC